MKQGINQIAVANGDLNKKPWGGGYPFSLMPTSSVPRRRLQIYLILRPQKQKIKNEPVALVI